MLVLNHFLEIERGRYTRIKKENRICKFCDLKEVEEEFHFFFRCKNNQTLRNILYKVINGICPKLIIIFIAYKTLLGIVLQT